MAKKASPKHAGKKPAAAIAAKVEPEKRPVGRPSKYRPEYCDEVIEMAKEGVGLAGYASKFEVAKSNLYDWANVHPEFSIALARAKAEEQAWWEKMGRQGMLIKGFNAVVWHKTMVAKFRDDYTEKITTEIVGKDGGPVQIESSTIDPRNMTQEQREALKIVMMALKEGSK